MGCQNNIYKIHFPIIVLLLLTTNIFAQRVVRYDLYVKDTIPVVARCGAILRTEE
jgi:hypothetical protein